MKKQRDRKKLNSIDDIPIIIELTHLFPGMKSIFTVNGRRNLDLIHNVMRGNRKFVLMRDEREMRGFFNEIK